MNTTDFTGPKAFGAAYEVMYAHDTHAPGSVDCEIVSTLVRVCRETAGYLYSDFSPTVADYEHNSRPVLEDFLSREFPSTTDVDLRIDDILQKVTGTRSNAPSVLANMRFGGTEEQIIRRGSDWCTDVARVACVLYQIAGFPCRIVNLVNIHAAYSGHVIVEVFRNGVWGAVDSSSGVVYRDANGMPVSTWELMNDNNLICAHAGAGAWYTTPEQFASAGISNYSVGMATHYDYTVSAINDYYTSILTMAEQGWPGGLRWLHGEEKSS